MNRLDLPFRFRRSTCCVEGRRVSRYLIRRLSTSHFTSMAYDGLGRRVRIEERDGTNSTVTNYLWCGSQICQKLDASNDIIAEYFDQGEEHDDTQTILLYQKDQLGSIRGTVTPQGTQRGSATYTAYGQTDRSSGTQADKGYAGMFLHQPSGLYLTTYRAYDPVTGRWLSRDPIGEQGGINLYGYVDGNPVNYTDPDGLASKYQPPPNPNKKPPPLNRVPSGQRERNVGHPGGEEHSIKPKGPRAPGGSRGAGFIEPSILMKCTVFITLMTIPGNAGQCQNPCDCGDLCYSNGPDNPPYISGAPNQ